MNPLYGWLLAGAILFVWVLLACIVWRWSQKQQYTDVEECEVLWAFAAWLAAPMAILVVLGIVTARKVIK